MKKTNDYIKNVLAFLFLIICHIGIILILSIWRSCAKTFIIFILISLGLLITSKYIKNEQSRKLFLYMAIFSILTTVMSWNYIECIMEPNNTMFPNYQADSEDLVIGAIDIADKGEKTYYKFGLYGTDRFPYIGQYGLQGKFFSSLTGAFTFDQTLFIGRMLCGYLAAAVFSGIVMLIKKKYNFLMAVCFFATFWLSPWVVCFARNMYWVEFTWFLPMLAGLFCSIFIKKRWCRITSYVAAFFTIFIKSLCGYEYISCVMLGLIAFLVVDLLYSIFTKDKANAILLLKTIIIMGVCAVLAFVAALLMHAQIRGSGDIVKGLKSIYDYEVMKRISINADSSLFDHPLLKESLEASLSDVFKRYYLFSTDIILGIPGKLFTLITVLPIFSFIYQWIKKDINLHEVFLYIVLFITCISWFVLAKPHSYVHTPLNFVLWYFGFVQICFYIVINQIRKLVNK